MAPRRQSTKVIDTTQSDSVNTEIVEATEKETVTPTETIVTEAVPVQDELSRIVEAEQNARRAEEEAAIRWRRLGRY